MQGGVNEPLFEGKVTLAALLQPADDLVAVQRLRLVGQQFEDGHGGRAFAYLVQFTRHGIIPSHSYP
jgi:hypothetical protein